MLIVTTSAPSENQEGSGSSLSRAGSRAGSKSGSEGNDSRAETVEGRSSGTSKRSGSRKVASHSTVGSRSKLADSKSPRDKITSGNETIPSGSVTVRARSEETSALTSESSEFIDSGVQSSVDIMNFHIDLPFSGRQNQNNPTQRSTQRNRHKKYPSSRNAHHGGKPLSPIPVELSSEQQQKVMECLWLIEPALDIHFDTDAIVEQVVLVESKGCVVELCENGQVRGICIVDEGELEVIDGGVVIDILLPGDFCGELAALFKVQQNINTKFQNRYNISSYL